MIPTQELIEYPVFGNAACLVKPGDAKYAAGFLPADVLPAEWHNWFLNKTTSSITCLNAGVGSMEAELNCVVTSAGLTPAEATPGQVAQAISCCVTSATSRTIQITDNAGTNCGNAVCFTSSTALQIKLPATICATLQGNAATATIATCACKDASGCSLGTAARYSCGTFVATAGASMTGPLSINSNYGDYREGLRINAGSCGYSTLTIGSPKNSTSGLTDGFWLGVNDGTIYCKNRFFINYKSSGCNSYFQGNTDGTVTWVGNVTGTASNATYATSAGSASTATTATNAGMATNAKGACTPFIIETEDFTEAGVRSYNEGLRINASECTCGYTTIAIGTKAGTKSGLDQGFWIGTNSSTAESKLWINYHSSGKNSYFQGETDGTVTWYGNVVGTAANANYATSAGSASTATNATYAGAAKHPFIVETTEWPTGWAQSYNEGIRINTSCIGWATFIMGGARGSVSGAAEGFWLGTNLCCATHCGKLYLNYKNSAKASYFQGNTDGTTTWVGNVTGTASCATNATAAGSAGSATYAYILNARVISTGGKVCGVYFTAATTSSVTICNASTRNILVSTSTGTYYMPSKTSRAFSGSCVCPWVYSSLNMV